jgi:hypothetical protein
MPYFILNLVPFPTFLSHFFNCLRSQKTLDYKIDAEWLKSFGIKKSKVKMKNTKKDFEINGVKAKQKISF